MNINIYSPKFILACTFGLLLLILAIVPSVYFYNQYRTAQKKLLNPNEYSKEEIRLLVEKVGKIIELPLDEEPTIATVTDADRLRAQPFFANSLNGDRVLIFTNAKKAYLYRPSTNKVIEVAPVNLGSNQATPSGETVPTPTSGIIEPVPSTNIISPSPAL